MNDDEEHRAQPEGDRLLDYRRAGGEDAGPALDLGDFRRVDAELRRRRHPALGWWRFGYGVLLIGGAGYLIGYWMIPGTYHNRDLASPRGRLGSLIAMISFAVICIGVLIVNIVRKRVMRDRRDGPDAG